ncbi:MAG TPA: hypothetical protein VLB12_10985 [Gemmatimonadales bacterium]|nr:hypothetical protein [Gemmatimonadales bacterium]
MTTARALSVAFGLVLLGMAGCGERHYARWDEPPPGAVSQVDSATAARNEGLEPGMLGAVQATSVTGWTGPGGRLFEVDLRSAAPEAGPARQFGSVVLPIALRNRAAALGQYPCTSCHSGAKVTMTGERIADAHQNIQPVHPSQTGATCSTCHAANDVEKLSLANGARTSLDEGYRLCGQCHFRQLEDWAGGAHGKRLDGWQGRRVVMACADCHDPHNPVAPTRIPFRAPQLERTTGYGP